MANIQGFKEEDWRRLGKAIELQRARIGLTQKRAAEDAGIGTTTWRELEKGKLASVRTLTLAAVAAVLDWPAEGPVNILFGGEAEAQDETIRTAFLDARLGELEERLERVEAGVSELLERRAAADSAG